MSAAFTNDAVQIEATGSRNTIKRLTCHYDSLESETQTTFLIINKIWLVRAWYVGVEIVFIVLNGTCHQYNRLPVPRDSNTKPWNIKNSLLHVLFVWHHLPLRLAQACTQPNYLAGQGSPLNTNMSKQKDHIQLLKSSLYPNAIFNVP